jgi:hypothetical protein
VDTDLVGCDFWIVIGVAWVEVDGGGTPILFSAGLLANATPEVKDIITIIELVINSLRISITSLFNVQNIQNYQELKR